jgi:hypothetical protein
MTVAQAAGLLVATTVIATALAAPLPSVAGNAALRKGASAPASAEHGLVVTKAAALAGAARTIRAVEWQRAVIPASALGTAVAQASAAVDPWSRFVHATGASWQSAWDRATQTPIRIWGEGMSAPGAMASAAVAEAFARRVIADHIALWAPGSSALDFRLVANDYDGDLRTLGFVQTFEGMEVVGGQMSFRFKRDRLFVIASEALPHVKIRASSLRSRLSNSQISRIREQVGQQLAAIGLPASAQVTALGKAEPVVLPIIGDDAVLGFRVVVPHDVNAAADGRWTLYADPSNGQAVAYESQSFFATGKLLYRVVNRYPGLDRINVPAARANVLIGGVSTVTAADGTVTWAQDSAQTLVPLVSGSLVTITNKAVDGVPATASLSISPGGQAIWDPSLAPADDAQVNVLVHVNTVKEYVRTFAPAMATLDDPINANVNIDKECNASFDGENLNFYRASTRCQNTGLLADVVYHEFGHAMHFNSIIEGVGRMDGAFSEGLSDFLSALITEDAGMGRGFFFDSRPLRDLDPAGREPSWPADVGEIHKTGIIFGAAMWDLRKDLITKLSREVAVGLVNRLYYAAVRRASDIPTTLVEILAADDDDGNLANGTPNECEILSAFGRHGLRVVTGAVDAPGALLAGPSRTQEVTFTLLGRSPRCASDSVTRVDVQWTPGLTGVPIGGSVVATQAGDPDHWTAVVPLPTSDAMKFAATVTFANTVRVSLPDNAADLSYQLYEGPTVVLACATMDQNPLASGWTGSLGWQWGPTTSSGATDPRTAFTGGNVLATVLGGNYAAKTSYSLTLPTIDVGKYSDVRLQYRRWLTVEDSQFDKAVITANGKAAWTNATEGAADTSSLHHLDREWRFHDVALSSEFRGTELTVGFELTTDEGLEFGGWALDDVCVVANPASICGDGNVTGGEQCDDAEGNSDSANACRVDCRIATCGDRIVDRGEECDEGESTERCAATCLLNDPAAGCCDSSGNSAPPLVLALIVLGLVTRRRQAAAAA